MESSAVTHRVKCALYLTQVNFVQVPLLAERTDTDVAVLAVQEQGLINVFRCALQLFPGTAQSEKAKRKQEEKKLLKITERLYQVLIHRYMKPALSFSITLIQRRIFIH